MNIDDLASAIEARRTELGWTQRDLSQRSGVSLTTISAIERRTRDQFQTTTLTSLDRALGWPLGHSGAMLRGDEPASELIITSRTPNSATLQALYGVAATLDDADLRYLIAEAQRLASGTPEVFHCEGSLSTLQDVNMSPRKTDTQESLSITVIENERERWMMTQHSTESADAHKVSITLQRVG